MINFNINIRNLFRNLSMPSKFIDILNFNKQISTNKRFEIRLFRIKNDANMFELNVDLNWKYRDCAGPSIDFQLFEFCFSIGIYDRRSWDHSANKWVDI